MESTPASFQGTWEGVVGWLRTHSTCKPRSGLKLKTGWKNGPHHWGTGPEGEGDEYAKQIMVVEPLCKL